MIMENLERESDNASDLIFGGVVGSKALRHVITDFEAIPASDSPAIAHGVNGNRRDALYKAVIALSRSISGRTDLRSLLSGVAESLRLMVRFDHLGLILHDEKRGSMSGLILNEPGNPVMTTLDLPVDEDPAGWVWRYQQPLVISRVQTETRWPGAM